jgi:hypothetical protein
MSPALNTIMGICTNHARTTTCVGISISINLSITSIPLHLSRHFYIDSVSKLNPFHSRSIPNLSSSTKSTDAVLNQVPLPVSYISKSMVWKTLKWLLPWIILSQIISSSTYRCFIWSTRSL